MDTESRYGIIIDVLEPYLDSSLDVINCSGVCRIWYRSINRSDRLWKRLCLSEINAKQEYWDWEDYEEWMLGAPCRWKRILMNYVRTRHNMFHNKFKEFTVESERSSPRLFVVDYDGQTLLVPSMHGLVVYQVVANITFRQHLDLDVLSVKEVKTNTDYIAVLYATGGLVIYKKMPRGYYNMCYLLKLTAADGLTMIETKRPITADFIRSFGLSTLNSIKLRLANGELILDFKSPGDSTCFLWNLPSRSFTNKFVGYECIKSVNHIVVLIECRSKRTIKLYNTDSSSTRQIELPCEMGTYFMNDNLLNIVLRKDNGGVCLSSWNIETGQKYLGDRELSLCTIPSRVISISKSIFATYTSRNVVRLFTFDTGKDYLIFSSKIMKRNFQKLILLVHSKFSSSLKFSIFDPTKCRNIGEPLYFIESFSGYPQKLNYPKFFRDIILHRVDERTVSVRFYR